MWEYIYLISGILILPVLLFAIIISIRATSVIAKYKKVTTRRGITARQLVEQIASEQGLDITLAEAGSYTGDHYDPRSKTVCLTKDIIDSNSVSALAIAAHEVGHAIQDKENYGPLKARQFVVGVSEFTNKILMPLVIISMLLTVFLAFIQPTLGYEVTLWILIGFAIIYGLSAVANLITLPCEFNASNRAKDILASMNMMDEDEMKAVGKVLRIAAWTYVVAFAISILYLIRILSLIFSIVGNR